MSRTEGLAQVFEGLLTLEHMATHVAHHFRVPPGVENLQISFSHTPTHPGVGNIAHQLSISVYGPDGACGTRHNNADQKPFISADFASPGYQPTPITAGEWNIEIDVHRILPPGNVAYRIEIVFDVNMSAPPMTEASPDLPRHIKRRGPGWYTGDLHGHTFHSDGDFSPLEYLQLAHQRGLDFVALTDHNTYSAVAQLKQLAGDGITVIGGVELTTFNGHALALAVDGWTEWRVKNGDTMSRIATSLQDSGALYIIAHPKSEGHPFCTGCRWAYSDMLPGPARHVEIWNREWADRSHNEPALHLFYSWLNEGFRMVATAGTDTHRPIPDSHRIAFNRVYAQDNTVATIMAALRCGHSYVTSGPDLALNVASEDGLELGMGDIVASGRVHITSRWQIVETDIELYACLIRQGKEINRWSCSESTDAVVETHTEPGCWFVLELRDRLGGLHGLTNPIFVGSEGKPWH